MKGKSQLDVDVKGDWVRLRYRRGDVFEEFYFDAEDGHRETVRRDGEMESSTLVDMLDHIPRVASELERRKMPKFAAALREYFDERVPPVVVALPPKIPEGVLLHDRVKDGYVFFYKQGDVYEEVELRKERGGIIAIPMRLRFADGKALRTKESIDILDPLAMFSHDMLVKPELRPYVRSLREYVRTHLQ